MKISLTILCIIALSSCGYPTNKKKVVTANIMEVPIYSITEEGVGDQKGTITVTKLPNGIEIIVNATNISTGEHGFHMHETNLLTPLTNSDGSIVKGGMARGHWDPEKTGVHLGPNGNGHRGDLVRLEVPSNGTIKVTMTNTRISYNDAKGKTFMIHSGGDNYTDNPKLGGGGARMYGAPFEY